MQAQKMYALYRHPAVVTSRTLAAVGDYRVIAQFGCARIYYYLFFHVDFNPVLVYRMRVFTFGHKTGPEV